MERICAFKMPVINLEHLQYLILNANYSHLLPAPLIITEILLLLSACCVVLLGKKQDLSLLVFYFVPIDLDD